MSNTEFLPQIVRLPQIRKLLISALPIRRELVTEDMLMQKAKEVNLLDYPKLENTAENVEVYMKVGEIEG